MVDPSGENIFEKPDSLWRSHREKIAWIILFLDLLITLLFWNSVQDAVLKDAQTRFDFRVEEIHASVVERLATYEQVLRGGMGLFKSTASVSRDTWKNYVDTLEIDRRFPGIQGIGFSVKVTPEEKEEHTRKIQAEGFPDYNIKPTGERDVYTSIIYLEPFNERNRQAFGYDMFSQSVRRTAMEKARDTGETAISGKVILVQEIDENIQSGFLMYLPLYREGMSIATPLQRRKALQGYVYSPFRMGNLMDGILGPKAVDVDFKIYDGRDVNDDVLMYDSGNVSNPSDLERDNPLFRTVRLMDLYGHHWTIQYTSLPSFESSLDIHKSNFVLILGVIFSGLCFFVIHGAFTTRRQAILYANEMSNAFRSKEERLSYALEGTNDGLWDWNVETGEVYFSARWMTMLGYEPNELEGHVRTWKVSCIQRINRGSCKN